MTNNVCMYFCSPGTFYKFVYLHEWQKTAIVIMPSEIAYYYAIHNLKTIQILLWRLKTKLTRRSQAFLGMSFRSARRSSCSFSKSSLPIGPAEAWLIGLSLKELTKQENKQWKKHQIYTVLRFRFWVYSLFMLENKNKSFGMNIIFLLEIQIHI